MPDYPAFVARHCEYVAQALIERIERYEGVSPKAGASLEERWIVVMESSPVEAKAA